MQSLSLNAILKKSNYHRPLIFNGILWLLAFVVLVFVFSKGNTPIKVDYIYTMVFLITLALPVSINFYILIPRLLKQEKYLSYAMSFIFNLVFFALTSSWFLRPLLDLVFTKYFFIAYLSKTDIFIVFSIFLVATTLIKFAEDWFYFNTNENKILRLKNQHIETQLSALRAQINPHFLFNSLNVIYALALEKKTETTKAIVQLSDILRYVIYDTDTERVILKDEVKLITNYIAFQNYRFKTPIPTDLNINIENEHYKIYPMLLLPLIENSYKYGIISGEEPKRIKIDLTQNKNNFEFCIKNTNLNTDNKLKAKDSGVGLKNLKNNLNLVYPNRHYFEVVETPEQFKVLLKLTNEI
ncbi:sensor histidine kinase [uncultured Winogradskyella sp.]|uniref:sensor histidine kinase n=1 Tax=uncultured Winogradskyella sp. TaxID=395353 RepID=UPI0026047982|nr:sensor histidine kinase [uncultured Winogradskyella sp.]